MRNEASIVRLPASGSRDFRARLVTLFEGVDRAGRIEPDAIADAWFIHDRWCAVYQGHACNCNPAIEIWNG
jgi:hypothetical protein